MRPNFNSKIRYTGSPSIFHISFRPNPRSGWAAVVYDGEGGYVYIPSLWDLEVR